MTKPLALIDSSVVFIATGQIGEAWAVVILEEAAKRDFRGCADVFHLLEIYDRYARLGEAYEGKLLARSFRPLLEEVLPLTEADFLRSAELAKKYPQINPRDLLHTAAAESRKVDEIFSIDGPRYSEVTQIPVVDLPALRSRLQLKEKHQHGRKNI